MYFLCFRFDTASPVEDEKDDDDDQSYKPKSGKVLSYKVCYVTKFLCQVYVKKKMLQYMFYFVEVHCTCLFNRRR